jgi:hypothetical protein
MSDPRPDTPADSQQRGAPTETHHEPTSARAMPHAHDGMVGPHGSMDDHGDAHGHDDHGHGAEASALGPINVAAWAMLVLGVVLGLLVVVALQQAAL